MNTPAPITPRGSGYTDCACRDCFEIAISDCHDEPGMCLKCKEAECEPDSECRARSSMVATTTSPERNKNKMINDDVISRMANGAWVPPIKRLTGYDCVCSVQDSPYRDSCPAHDPTHPAQKVLEHHEKETKILFDVIRELAARLCVHEHLRR